MIVSPSSQTNSSITCLNPRSSAIFLVFFGDRVQNGGVNAATRMFNEGCKNTPDDLRNEKIPIDSDRSFIHRKRHPVWRYTVFSQRVIDWHLT
jgi:hypothetical protein